MQRGRQEPLYVDTEHYTARFSREIALRIAEAIVSDGGPCAARSVSE